MGIIQKQSIRSSLFILIGFGIGAVNMLVLFPRFFSPGEFGLTRGIIDISLTLSVLCTLGSIPVINKFFPFYNDHVGPEKNDLPFITAIVCGIGFLLVWITGYFFRDFFIRKLGRSPEVAHYFYTIYPYTFLLLAYMWLEAFGWALKKTVLTNFLKETMIRAFTTLLVLFYGFKLIGFHSFINLFSLLYLLPVLVLLIVLVRSGKWKLKMMPISNVTRRLKKKLIIFGLFIFGAQFLNVLARSGETIFVIGFKGLADTAMWSIAVYVAAIMEIPQRSLTSISIPVLAESWKEKNMANIEHVYTKSVSNLLTIGLGMFGIIWLNINSLVAFLNKLGSGHANANYAAIGPVVLIMGMAKVIDLGTGINSQIIGTSKFWKFDFYTNVFLTFFSIPLNFFLIKRFGLLGLASSYLISFFIFNAIRYVFLWKKFGLQPYTFRNLLIIIASTIIYIIIYHVPSNSNLYIDVVLRSLIFSALFIPAVLFTKAAPDLTAIATSSLKKMTGIFKK